MIELSNVNKSFKVPIKKEGLKGSVTSLFKRDSKVIHAVEDISLNIQAGEIVGFLGPNGAGKSTTIKMMTGILKADSGSIKINNYNPFDEREKYVKHIGVIFGQRSQLWWELPIGESFKIIKEMYHVSDEDYKKNMNLFKEFIDLDKLLNSPARTLSLGQRMLCDIAAVLLHNPKVIFLDEPTIGLDISVKSKIRELILRINEENKTTIILTTHDISDVTALCERIIVIDKGKILYNGDITNVSTILGEMQGVNVRLKDSSDNLVHEIKRKYSEEEIIISNLKEQWLRIEFDKNKIEVANILNFIFKHTAVEDIKLTDPDIEVVLKKIYDGGLL